MINLFYLHKHFDEQNHTNLSSCILRLNIKINCCIDISTPSPWKQKFLLHSEELGYRKVMLLPEVSKPTLAQDPPFELAEQTSRSSISQSPSTPVSPLPSPTLFFISQDVQEVCVCPWKLSLKSQRGPIDQLS